MRSLCGKKRQPARTEASPHDSQARYTHTRVFHPLTHCRGLQGYQASFCGFGIHIYSERARFQLLAPDRFSVLALQARKTSDIGIYLASTLISPREFAPSCHPSGREASQIKQAQRHPTIC